MRRSAHLLAGLFVDALAGDPQGLPHPVRSMGGLAAALEPCARKVLGDTKPAGAATEATVLAATLSLTLAVRALARRLHPAAGDLAEVVLIWWCLAPRDLADHAWRVQRALDDSDLEAARARVAWMVGRDTADLDIAGVVRAASESVAENTVDGVTAPLCYAALGGAPLAMLYKAVSTLDSTFGYRDDRYREFGWAAARLDDLAAYLPARVTPPFIALAAAVCREHPGAAWRAFRRDGRNHSSPNSGLAEAAFAGALGVRFGGPVRRGGQLIDAPYMGEGTAALTPSVIGRAVRLMLVTTGLMTAVAAAIAIAVRRLGERAGRDPSVVTPRRRRARL